MMMMINHNNDDDNGGWRPLQIKTRPTCVRTPHCHRAPRAAGIYSRG